MSREHHKYKDTHRSVRGRKQKYCIKCNQWKDVSEFNIDRDKRDGLNIKCRDCDRAYQIELRRKYRSKRKVRVYLRLEQRHRIINGVREKCCSKCGKWKKESEYFKERSTKDGLSAWCKKCSHKPTKKRRRVYLKFEERHRTVNGIKEKYCTKCNRWKRESEFYTSRSHKDGLATSCIKCSYKPRKKTERIYLGFDESHRIINGIKEKLCRKCRKWKREDEFYTCRSNRDGLSDRCKTCSYQSARKSV
jgi:hypothetical protein